MRKKKEESIENFLNKLIRAKGCFDVAEMESYIKEPLHMIGICWIGK